MAEKGPWDGGPNVTEEEFQEHLKEVEKLLKKEETKFKFYELGPEDDVGEFFESIFGANTQNKG